MNITLIGGSGFVGTRLLALLGEQPEKYTLRNIDKRQSHFFPHVTQLADVRDAEALREKIAGSDVVVLLAAEHRDDVSPVSLYYDVNVGGMKNVLEAMLATGVRRLVFTSSVAVYGLNKENPDETHPADPFNHYGKSKWQAEEVLQQWHAEHPDFNIGILRPTVIFGERNRGNVFNLLRQISSGRFLMIGGGRNRKSMAYVGNIVSFIRFLIDEKTEGYNVYNYVDKPDFTMNELVFHVSEVLGKHIPTTHFPYWLGMLGGKCFDLLAAITRKKLTISSVRVKKFCATTQFDARKAHASGFSAPYTLGQGLERTLRFEFIEPPKDDITFKSE
ncbi:NAD-dependent epimerase/dehydratase family protein [uncultured Alistipes sp.]|jgi:nucleoside-diphosphate-sugar epimerase|uniref:NAD-dependent epimerase/dehydratase family protein n=1 Tax=uncultured Alistipes sp. TaxID=538949 RepID=UPI0026060574|nr:NAD-dependent epimerase/dehydratase family protein [uncultured Alistipes sp.]